MIQAETTSARGPGKAHHNRARLLQRHSRNRTACVGISLVTTASNRRDGTAQRFFSVHCRGADGRARNRKFCIETLGREEAWRRAVACRAAHERGVMARTARAGKEAA